MTINVSKVTSRPFADIDCLSSDCPSRHVIAEHVHEKHQIVHAVEGVMRVHAANAIWVVPPGRGLWMPARLRHSIRCAGPVRLRTVYLGGDEPAFPDNIQVFEVSAFMRELIIRLTEGVSPAIMHHHYSILLDELKHLKFSPLFLPQAKDQRIAKMGLAFLENPTDQTNLGGWADQLGFSPRTLMRRIYDETGMSFREYRRQARVLASMELLAIGTSVTNAAFDAGFESPSAFIQSFKAVTGGTPGRFLAMG